MKERAAPTMGQQHNDKLLTKLTTFKSWQSRNKSNITMPSEMKDTE
jgi:hypothetical protein